MKKSCMPSSLTTGNFESALFLLCGGGRRRQRGRGTPGCVYVGVTTKKNSYESAKLLSLGFWLSIPGSSEQFCALNKLKDLLMR